MRNYFAPHIGCKNANDGFPILCRKMFHNKRIPLFSMVLSDENRGIFFVNIVLKIADAIRDGKPVPYRKLP